MIIFAFMDLRPPVFLRNTAGSDLKSALFAILLTNYAQNGERF